VFKRLEYIVAFTGVWSAVSLVLSLKIKIHDECEIVPPPQHVPKRLLHLLNVSTYLCSGRSRTESWDRVSDSSGEDSTSRIIVSQLRPALGWHVAVAVRYIV
jgi:hypothetical protein